MNHKKRDDMSHKLFGHIKPNDPRVAVKSCPVCHKGSIIKPGESIDEYSCSYCMASETQLTEGFFLPMQRRGTLCSGYHPIAQFVANDYDKGDTITYKTSRGTIISSTVLVVDPIEKHNQLLVKDSKGIQQILTDETRISNAYEDLCESNRMMYTGWWNYRLFLVKQKPTPDDTLIIDHPIYTTPSLKNKSDIKACA